MIRTGLTKQWLAIAGATVAVTAAGVLVATGRRADMPVATAAAVSSAHPWPVPKGPAPHVALGVTVDALAKNEWSPWKASDLGQVNAFEQGARAHMGVVMWFADWTQPFLPAQAAAVAARGSIPEITWEPWSHKVGLHKAQPAYRLSTIIAGKHDAYIRGWARAIKKYGGPVRIRFAHEMNSTAYPWGTGVNGNKPGQYVKAWRHVHDIFTKLGVRNVQWVWSPLAGNVPTSMYPGSRYVNIIGLSAFNGGKELDWGGWLSFAKLFGPGVKAAQKLAPGKPIEISETASAARGGSKAAWITAMFTYVEQHPQIRTLAWFNVDKETNWTIESSPAAQRAFAAGAARLQAPGRSPRQSSS